ncbi:hypothetical protein EDEG_00717 [Edhazardia aedis USNM 41457]|uniref:Uncharacterized protein n=1 Tax=Edhazardia aedis (strain USNM 41457) TaxID=1003232 RepID=J9DRJ3_EDHAE|nr:hypothetical protein EDEG_00717 [Edhazardia aedis USNM 41457]|eukprot:EJW05185.1 hypothetical protein EDEG_00717 [Edhazardia aedis USNM 41457]
MKREPESRFWSCKYRLRISTATTNRRTSHGGLLAHRVAKSGLETSRSLSTKQFCERHSQMGTAPTVNSIWQLLGKLMVGKTVIAYASAISGWLVTNRHDLP